MIGLALVGTAGGATLSRDEVLTRAERWLAHDPLMQGRSLAGAQVEGFPADAPDACLYIASFSGGGYLVLGSEDRLPLVVAFSASAPIRLDDRPENALRAMLVRYIETLPQRIVAASDTVRTLALPAGDVLVGPWLTTRWDQCNPYNAYCPDDPAGTAYYGFRVPAGCVPVAYAQVLNYHRWPVRGTGLHAYVDTRGATTGAHDVDFSDAYDWGHMVSGYSAFGTAEPEQAAAVAELIYELGVGAEIDYESDGSALFLGAPGPLLAASFFFELPVYHAQFDALQDPMDADLAGGYPVVVGIEGHAIVVDGVRVLDGAKTYHINYGWGGQNDGWWMADNVAGDAIRYGVTGIRPRLLPFPEQDALSVVAAAPFELRWILPKHRTNEVVSLTVQVEQGEGNWVDLFEDSTLRCDYFSAETTTLDETLDFSVFEETSSAAYGAWALVTNAGQIVFRKWHEEAYSNHRYHLTSRAPVVPTARTRLVLTMQSDGFADNFFRVLVSPDRMEWTEVGVLAAAMDWGDWAVELGAYAAQPVYLRLEYGVGSYYAGHATQIDTIALQETTHPELEGQPIHRTAMPAWSEGTYRVRGFLTDTNGTPQGAGPEFSVRVDPAWSISRIEWRDDALRIGFPSRIGYVYTVESCTNLHAGEWSVFGMGLTGTGAEIEFFDPAPGAIRFYRVVAAPLAE